MKNFIFDWGGKNVCDISPVEQTRLYLDIFYKGQSSVYISPSYKILSMAFLLKHPEESSLRLSPYQPNEVTKEQCIKIVHNSAIAQEIMLLINPIPYKFMRIESDIISLSEQFECLNNMHKNLEDFQSMVQCCFFSGGRSIHCILSIPEPHKTKYFEILHNVKRYMPSTDIRISGRGPSRQSNAIHYTRIVGAKRGNHGRVSFLYLK